MYREYGKLNLDKITRVINDLSNDQLIHSKIEISNKIKNAQSEAKEKKCYFCGQKCSSFCNSHTVPAFSLRYIALEGKVFTSQKVMDIKLMDTVKGVKNSGTFQIICNRCDNSIFQEYENPENYINGLTTNMLAQIHLKNILKKISKRKMEIQLYNDPVFGSMGKQRNSINNIDLKEFEQEFNYAKRKIKKNSREDYQIIFHQKLDYVVPIAFQGSLTMPIDLEGNIINNIYNSNPKYKIKSIQIAILPMESTSEIILFTEKENLKYRKFCKQLNQFNSLEKQLSIINNLIFLYSEDYFISPNVPINLFNELKTLAGEMADLFIESGFKLQELNSILKADLEKINNQNIPNLLSEKFKLMKEQI